MERPLTRHFIQVLTSALFFCSLAMAQQSAAVKPTSANYGKLVDQYFDESFTFHPTAGTAARFYQYDAVLEDYSPKSREALIAFLKRERQTFASLHTEQLTPEQRADVQILTSDIDSQLLELEQIRGWQRNPNTYSSGP